MALKNSYTRRELSIQIVNRAEYELFVKRKLSAYENQFLNKNPLPRYQKISWYVKDADGKLQGGLLAETSWGALHIDYLWIAPSFRKKGYGKELLEKAEDWAKEKGCHILLVQSSSFHAPEFYKHLGFETVGVLDDYPKGYRFFYLSKKINEL